MMTKKTTPTTARRRPRQSKSTPAQKRDRLIEKLLSVDELGQVAGGYVCSGACEGR
jgi:hypothetical protein